MCHVFSDARFTRLAGISNGHIYNLRKSRAYRTGRLTFRETRPTPVGFGVRRKPQTDGRPGFLRVDTVHLGDLGGRKGTYVINVVDEVTQFQHLGAVPRITQHYMVPVLKDLISAFPFTVQAFHAVNPLGAPAESPLTWMCRSRYSGSKRSSAWICSSLSLIFRFRTVSSSLRSRWWRVWRSLRIQTPARRPN